MKNLADVNLQGFVLFCRVLMPLPLVPDFLRESHQVIDLQRPAVIQNRRPAELSEHLMLIGTDDPGIDPGASVHHRLKLQLKPFVITGKDPRRQIVFFSVLHGNVKYYLVQFVNLSLIKQYVFAGGGSIAETIADIKAEGHTANQSGSRAPVPGIVIRPDAASPVQHGKRIFRIAAVQLIFWL